MFVEEGASEEQLASMDEMNKACKYKKHGADDDDEDDEDDGEAAGEEGEEEKKKRKKKKKRRPKPTVIVSRLTRSRRKFVTLVTGLAEKGVNPKAAAKRCAKKFACGCAVIKGTKDVEIQGDVTYELVEFLLEEYPEQLTKHDIGFGEDRRK